MYSSPIGQLDGVVQLEPFETFDEFGSGEPLLERLVENLVGVDVPGGEILGCPTTVVLVFDEHRVARGGDPRVTANPGLDARHARTK